MTRKDAFYYKKIDNETDQWIKSSWRPLSCRAKLIKTIEEKKIVHYVLLSYDVG